jgi:RNA polymerase sigma-70 factor, ECF subfamily
VADAALLTALRARDEGAFLEVVARHQGALVRVAMAHALDRAAAEAAVREAWSEVIAGLDRFDGRPSLRAWISGIAAACARARAARDGMTPAPALAAAEADAPAPAVERERFMGADSVWAGHWRDPPRRLPREADLGPGARAQVAGAALTSLPPVQRAVVGLRDVEGWTAAEVCAALGIDPAAERVLLHRGRACIRRALELHVDGR